MIRVVWDTETAPVSQRCQAPPMACLSWCSAGDSGIVHHTEAGATLHSLFNNEQVLHVGHHIPYDLAVAAAHDLSLLPKIYKALREDRVTDTLLREKLVRIAEGSHFGRSYSLANVVKHYLDKTMDKDTWRLQYGELMHLPLSEWPQGAIDYAIGDAVDTDTVFVEQEKFAAVLHDQYRQTRKAFWLELASIWGIKTDPDSIARLRESVMQEFVELRATLIDDGLIRVKSTKKRTGPYAGQTLITYHKRTKETQAAMQADCEARGVEPKRTDTGLISIAAEECEAAGSEVLQRFGRYSGLADYVNKDLPLLEAGVHYPIHTRFDSLKETGRTGSSKPNIQNIKRVPGVRECFVPRPGKVFIDCDYDGLELRTMAQVCMSVFKFSRLADVLNAGEDPHLMVGASILGISYKEAKQRFEAGDEEVDTARQTGKVANFGFPGGLGYETLCKQAWSIYRVELTEDKARQLKAVWLSTFPEFRQYFAWIEAHLDGTDRGAFKHLFSDRVRGNCRYTQLCNTPFQGLGGDATGHAGFLISEACYIDTASPLYGSRIVNYIHDQFIVETDDNERAHDAAIELARLMVIGANEFLPDVPATCTPALCRQWSKKTKPIYDANRRLIPWDYRNQSAA